MIIVLLGGRVNAAWSYRAVACTVHTVRMCTQIQVYLQRDNNNKSI